MFTSCFLRCVEAVRSLEVALVRLHEACLFVKIIHFILNCSFLINVQTFVYVPWFYFLWFYFPWFYLVDRDPHRLNLNGTTIRLFHIRVELCFKPKFTLSFFITLNSV